MGVNHRDTFALQNLGWPASALKRERLIESNEALGQRTAPRLVEWTVEAGGVTWTIPASQTRWLDTTAPSPIVISEDGRLECWPIPPPRVRDGAPISVPLGRRQHKHHVQCDGRGEVICWREGVPGPFPIEIPWDDFVTFEWCGEAAAACAATERRPASGSTRRAGGPLQGRRWSVSLSWSLGFVSQSALGPHINKPGS